MATHHLDDTQTHAFWDKSYPAHLHIQPGDTVVFETREGSDKQIRPDSTSEVLRTLNLASIHPLTGPVYVPASEHFQVALTHTRGRKKSTIFIPGDALSPRWDYAARDQRAQNRLPLLS